MEGNFESLAKLAEKGSAKGKVAGKGQAKSNVSISVNGKGKNIACLVVRIGSDIMKVARFIKGDRVDILVDKEAGLLLIKRDPNGRYKISGAKNNNSGAIKATLFTGFPYPEELKSMVNISYPDAGILCELPENMRYYVKGKATGE